MKDIYLHLTYIKNVLEIFTDDMIWHLNFALKYSRGPGTGEKYRGQKIDHELIIFEAGCSVHDGLLSLLLNILEISHNKNVNWVKTKIL